jgi:PhzF family phenazine biosynthesis protein
MTSRPEILRYAAFTQNPGGGNPAGVVLDATGLDEPTMQAIAAEVGYSETAFLTSAGDDGRSFGVRYFAPSIEVPFCGHATIAAAVALGERRGVGGFLFRTRWGDVPVDVVADDASQLRATLTSVEPTLVNIEEADLDALLSALRWAPEDIDPAFPPMVAFGGVWHPVIAARTRARLADLDYDFEAIRVLMTERSWTTIQLVWRESATVFDVRDPFAVGGVVEDPATGAAAAAFGHYLRATGLVEPPVTLTLRQGVDLGRPSLLVVEVDDADPRIKVSGYAIPIMTHGPSESITLT